MTEQPTTPCPECGAPVSFGGTCKDAFYALLALEAEVPGGPGNLPHFYAVSSYVLQHPISMEYRTDSLAWLRSAVRDALEGRAGVEDLRRGARTEGKAGGRVLRREGDPVQEWGVAEWSTNVADVLAGGVEGYADRVTRWAASILSDIEDSARR